MSLPISPMQCTTAKMLANVSTFLVVWLAIAGGVIGTIAPRARRRCHPLAVITSLAPFVAFCLLVSVAIVTESSSSPS
jgi:hypothetical protein